MKTDIGIIIDYEVRSSGWAAYVSWGWLQTIVAKYFSWKVKRKYDRWQSCLVRKYQLELVGQELDLLVRERSAGNVKNNQPDDSK